MIENIDHKKEFELYLKVITIPKNYTLISNFSKDIRINTKITNYELDTSEYTKDEITLYVSFKSFEQSILDFCYTAFTYNDKPIKLISWLKSHISKFDIESRKIILKYINIILLDKDRFPFEVETLLNGINRIDIEVNYEIINDSATYFFTNSNKINIDLFIESFMYITGLIKSKNEVIETFFKDYDSKDLIESANKYITNQTTTQPTPPQKEIEPINTPKILNESLDILFDSLKAKYIKCNKTDYNKLFNGSKIDSFKIEWFGSIGLLKELFNQLHSKYKFENRNYYKAIFQFTKEQYKNNKVSTKDKKTTTLLLQ